MRKGEIALYQQFLLFLQCFQKTFTADTYKPGLYWEWVIGHQKSGLCGKGLMKVIPKLYPNPTGFKPSISTPSQLLFTNTVENDVKLNKHITKLQIRGIDGIQNWLNFFQNLC